MENNVEPKSYKRIMINIAAALLIFIILTVFFGIPSDTRRGITVNEITSANLLPYESNGVTYSGKGSFSVLSYPSTAMKGGPAFLEVHSIKENEISIEVYYASGISTSNVFTPRTPDENGIVLWEWIISANTSADRVRIILRSEDTTAQLYIDII